MSRAATRYDIPALRTAIRSTHTNIAARELKPACKAAGIPAIGWHVLRHTAITLLQQAGATGSKREGGKR